MNCPRCRIKTILIGVSRTGDIHYCKGCNGKFKVSSDDPKEQQNMNCPKCRRLLALVGVLKTGTDVFHCCHCEKKYYIKDITDGW